MRIFALLMAAIIFSPCVLFSQESDDCEGWAFNVESEYSLENCETSLLSIDLDLGGSDGEDDLFYLTILFDTDVHISAMEVTPGQHLFELTDVPWSGELTVSISTSSSPPSCDETLVIPVDGENLSPESVDLVEYVGSTSATCGSMQNGQVVLVNPMGSEPIVYEGALITPDPGGISFVVVSGGNLIVSGFPAGDYCITFYLDSGQDCMSSDQVCFTVGTPNDGEFEIEDIIYNMMSCDYPDVQDAWFEVVFPNAVSDMETFEVLVTNTETGVSSTPDWTVPVPDSNNLAFGEFSFGSYLFEITDANSNCHSSFEYVVDTSLEPEPVYEIEIIVPPDDNGLNATIVVNLVTGPFQAETFTIEEFSPDQFTVGEEIAGIWLGDFTLNVILDFCAYQIPFQVIDNAVPGCTDSAACNYNSEANIDNGTCSYYLNCGDLSGDGEVDITDLLNFLGQIGCIGNSEDCPGDLNGDGIVNLSDLLILLGLL